MALIKQGRVAEADSWQMLEDHQPLAAGDIIVSTARWNAERKQLLARQGGLGLRLGPADDVEDLIGDLETFNLIAVEFPKFTDGRGYSIARLLRERFGFRGELRAIGDVLPDQVAFMQRCGFDSMLLAERCDPQVAIAALTEIDVHYQATGKEQPFWSKG